MSVTASVEIDQRIIAAIRAIESGIGSVLLGKPAQVRMATAALISGEHLLLNDLPGVGKTSLGTALARVVDGVFGRIQGTPDLLPTDVTGSSIFNQTDGLWVFRPGPLMANVVLVDELNRITPRSQSALLEAMAEGSVTVDGVTRPVPVPFMVVATMNPTGSAGTFPLTIGQLDRFGAALGLGSVDRETERLLLRGGGGVQAADQLKSVLPADLMPELRTVVARVHLAEPLVDYVLDICDALRPAGHLSTRAAQSMVTWAQALALLDGRSFVVPDDLKTLAVPCLAHRLAGEGERIDAHHISVRSAVEELNVPDRPAS
ncbi:MAG: AAA domain-containing protein [Actinomycetia bacterium]|nr:AAA domain-containing protein [Actinomycetes bacterium]